MNTLEFALKMEMDGKAYYEQLASETTVAGLKTIFANLAADEQKHYDTVKMMCDEVTAVMPDSTALENAKNIFQDLIRDKAGVEGLKKSLDGYQHAMQVEAVSVKFYEEMAAKETSPANKQLLLTIAGEEKKHFNIMDNLYDYTLAPQNFLAWGEFSNLKEL
jgi:rubrerythrin